MHDKHIPLSITRSRVSPCVNACDDDVNTWINIYKATTNNSLADHQYAYINLCL